MSEEVVSWRREGHVGWITINRPQALNALNSSVLAGLEAVLDTAAAEDGLRAVVLTGAGKAFVAGADIGEMKDFSALEAEAFAVRGQAIAEKITRLAAPVIAAVNGYALGGGCELAMACDIVLAGPYARFGQPEVKLGLIPGFGGTQRLTRRAGLAVALDLCLTGRVIKPQEAVRIGIASRAVEGDVVEAAAAVAAEIAANGPVAVRLCKRAIHENADSDLRAGLAAEVSLFAMCFTTEDQREGMAAFVEKRAAEFVGR
jgi:enoyl-CoA hydratase